MVKSKQEYRLWAKKNRKTFDIAHISGIICSKIMNLEEYKNAKIIAAFYPCGYETDISPLFKDLSKNWYLPVVIDEENMVFRKYENYSKLTLNNFGIYEPSQGCELNINELDLIITPALLVDQKGHRLGYGKGYYDRFFAQLSKSCIKLVPIADELLVDRLPIDEYDIPVDLVVTQKTESYFTCTTNSISTDAPNGSS